MSLVGEVDEYSQWSLSASQPRLFPTWGIYGEPGSRAEFWLEAGLDPSEQE